MQIDSTEVDAGTKLNRDITPSQVLYMAKGFSWIFWGLVLGIISFFGNATIKIFNTIRIPAYVIGSFLVAWGLFVMYDTNRSSNVWQKRIRIAIVFVLLEIYFAPFTEWRQAMPYVSFYMFNCLALLFTSMLALFYINLIAAEVCHCLNDRQGQLISKLSAASVVLLLIAPLLISVTFAVTASLRYQTSFYMETWHIINLSSPLVYFFVIIPFVFTLSASWKARNRCYHELITRDSAHKPFVQ